MYFRFLFLFFSVVLFSGCISSRWSRSTSFRSYEGVASGLPFIDLYVDGPSSSCIFELNYKHNQGSLNLYAKKGKKLPPIGIPFSYLAKKVTVTPHKDMVDVSSRTFLEVYSFQIDQTTHKPKCFDIKKSKSCGTILSFVDHFDDQLDIKFVFNSNTEKKELITKADKSLEIIAEACFENRFDNDRPIAKVRFKNKSDN